LSKKCLRRSGAIVLAIPERMTSVKNNLFRRVFPQWHFSFKKASYPEKIQSSEKLMPI
jgi:hypothetical protein